MNRSHLKKIFPGTFVIAAFIMAALAQTSAPRAATPERWKSVTKDADPHDLSGQLAPMEQKRALLFNDKSSNKKPLDSTEPVRPRVQTSNLAPAFLRLSPVPVQESDTVIVGQVLSFQPRFSADHSHLYTEVTIRVEERMKGGEKADAGKTISLLFRGGRLRLPGGREISEEFVPSNYHLAENTRYVMFLNYFAPMDCFQVVKTWELRNGKALPTAAEDVSEASNRNSRYASINEGGFIQLIKQALELNRDQN
jgi:hypothetical protein